jgi:hypothetical protein
MIVITNTAFLRITVSLYYLGLSISKTHVDTNHEGPRLDVIGVKIEYLGAPWFAECSEQSSKKARSEHIEPRKNEGPEVQ